MSAFLAIDACIKCKRSLPWEWVPPVLLSGRPLAGTGVWRSVLAEGLCPDCFNAAAHETERRKQLARRHALLSAVLGGAGACRKFTFDSFEPSAENARTLAYARAFQAAQHNFYIVGPPGVGKTHLAYAIASAMIMQGRTATVSTLPQLIRQLRMKPPEEEQAVLERHIRSEVLVIDDLVYGSETPYARQMLQEILDRRGFGGRRGLIVTGRLAPRLGAQRGPDSTIAAILASMCHVMPLVGPDRRWAASKPSTCTGSGAK